MYVDIYVKQPLFFSDFNKSLFFSAYFQKIHKYFLHENPSSESGVVPCGRTDERTDTTKITVFFQNFGRRLKTVLLIYFYNWIGS